jgi:hypothetical protein
MYWHENRHSGKTFFLKFLGSVLQLDMAVGVLVHLIGFVHFSAAFILPFTGFFIFCITLEALCFGKYLSQ